MTNNGLPSSHILRGNITIRKIIEKGIHIKSNYIHAYVILDEDAPKLYQVGFIVPKRLGHAVQRNRCRRLMKESFRLQQNIIKQFCYIYHQYVMALFLCHKVMDGLNVANKEMKMVLQRILFEGQNKFI